jgi:light-regulated signal transduction histidine kinase (bacteriophytochrome)
MTTAALKVLIADDDLGDREQVKRALRQAGLTYECVEAASVEAALGACDGNEFDVAIVDYRMPGYNGLHGVSMLQQRVPSVPIIMVTGQGDELVATEATRRGAADYLPKAAVRPEALKRAVLGAVERTALRQKVREQQETLERFAAILVHDLKSPLTSIQGFAGIALAALQSAPADTGKAANSCQSVVKVAQGMHKLIDTLHEYTQIDSQVEFGAVDMARVMDDVASALHSQISARGAQVTWDDLPTVRGNAPQLHQLLQNLIGNGLKYCESDRPAVHVAAEPHPAQAWRFGVKDNGIGIPASAYKRVFEPFQRLHERGKYDGTGLGLATCRKIVERHGGDI